jgi:hypothetical protein
MYMRGVPVGADWGTAQIAFSAVITLIYVVLDTSNADEADKIFKDIAVARKVHDIVADRSTAADRCRTVVTV